MNSKKPRTLNDFQGVAMPTSAHPAIRKVRRAGAEPSIHGNKLWKSSALLIDYLQKHPPEHRAKVLDVGCGWGVAGIWCAKTFGSHVTALDADPDVFPFLQVAAKLNQVEITPLVSQFEELSIEKLSEYDMLIGADICFWDELADPVTNMVDRAVTAGVKHILIADPEREPFHNMAQRCVDRHLADLIEWQASSPVTARGAIMIIENA